MTVLADSAIAAPPSLSPCFASQALVSTSIADLCPHCPQPQAGLGAAWAFYCQLLLQVARMHVYSALSPFPELRVLASVVLIPTKKIWTILIGRSHACLPAFPALLDHEAHASGILRSVNISNEPHWSRLHGYSEFLFISL
jgi:hypothetical protein